MDILDLIYPKQCLECKKQGSYICASCLSKVETVGIVPGQGYALWRYDGVIRKAILALKYKFASDIANELAVLASKKFENWNLKLENYALLPIPLHTKRKRWRGFNQSEELGKRLAKLMNWGYRGDLLVRVRHTTPQARLSRHERMRNTRGIFAVNNHQSLITNHQSLILFDDVWTTGSTLGEAEKVLKYYGAKKIYKITICK